MLLSRPASILISTYVLSSKRTLSTSSEILAERVYINADQDKELIVNENKGRTGIYRWVHRESGKTYIGSSNKLNLRFKQYFNYNHISYPKRNMPICKALLKYGYAEFSLEILEYCSTDVLLKKEQYYFDKCKPEYNILKIAGSPLGYKHSEAAKKLIGLASKNRIVSESSRDIRRKSLIGITFDDKRLDKMRLSNTFRKSVLLTNTETGKTQEFSSMTDAGIYLDISRVSVRKYLLNNMPYKGYTISKAPSNDIGVTELSSTSSFIQQQPVRLTNKLTGISKEFSSMVNAAKYLDISRARLGYFLNNMSKTDNVELKGYTVFKITDTQVKVNRKYLKVEVTDIYTNEVKTYPSLTLAAEALGVPRASLSGYFCKKRTNPYKNKYNLKLV
jgi:group I intron endonuclease